MGDNLARRCCGKNGRSVRFPEKFAGAVSFHSPGSYSFRDEDLSKTEAQVARLNFRMLRFQDSLGLAIHFSIGEFYVRTSRGYVWRRCGTA
jgi:hypothetical protein